jgi:alpha-beta hydrolase superfamily lysophospholipase
MARTTDRWTQVPTAIAALRAAPRAALLRDAATPEYPAPPPAGRWAPDVLGRGFEARTLPLADDDEGPVVATLVRHAPATPRTLGTIAPAPVVRPLGAAVRAAVPIAGRGPARPGAVLYLHGWNDYFFQRHLAEFWHAQGLAFYALDLRKYGRSLRVHHTPGYVEDLAAYDEDIDAALAVVRGEVGEDADVVLMGHSTGGLTASLWAHRHPGALRALVLNSPWLELQGSELMRLVTAPVVEQLARFNPKAPLPALDPGYYARTIDAALDGEWTLDPRWRLSPSMAVRPGWFRAILDGHAQVAAGLAVDAPVLMVTSARTLISAVWSEEMRASDIVLDVELLGRRALQLGPVVTVVRVEGALHDVLLSPSPVRERAYGEIARWLRAYVDR